VKQRQLGPNRALCVLLALMIPVMLAAQVRDSAESGQPGSHRTVDDVGLIFNMSNILLDLEGYQAGLGAKVGWGNLYVRGLLDFVANGSASTLSLNAGATVEYHLLPRPLSFYVGGSVGAGYTLQNLVAASTRFTLAAVAGIEYWPFEFVSVFAEYAIAGDFSFTKDLQTSVTSFDYLIDTAMGNDSKIGLVIHLVPPAARN
jgi:hypothetical protein